MAWRWRGGLIRGREAGDGSSKWVGGGARAGGYEFLECVGEVVAVSMDVCSFDGLVGVVCRCIGAGRQSRKVAVLRAPDAYVAGRGDENERSPKGCVAFVCRYPEGVGTQAVAVPLGGRMCWWACTRG